MANAALTMAKYRATARKAHAAYLALKEANESNPVPMGIARSLDTLAGSFNDLRIVACNDCPASGRIESARGGGWATTCLHPKVPMFNVRTGVFDEV
jgi:hypothetical protein